MWYFSLKCISVYNFPPRNQVTFSIHSQGPRWTWLGWDRKWSPACRSDAVHTPGWSFLLWSLWAPASAYQEKRLHSAAGDWNGVSLPRAGLFAAQVEVRTSSEILGLFFQIVDGLRVFPYPTARPNNEQRPLVGVSVTLPDWVVYMEPPLVARWDAGGTCNRNHIGGCTAVFIHLEPFHILTCYNYKMWMKCFFFLHNYVYVMLV